MYILLEYSDNCSKTSGSLFKCYEDEAALDNTGAIADFTNNNTTHSFKFIEKITGQAGNNGTKNVEIFVPIKI